MSFFHLHDHDHHPRRGFLKRSFAFLGAWASAPLAAGPAKPAAHAPEPESQPPAPASPHPQAHVAQPPTHTSKAEPYAVFDAHLHCPSDSTQQVWQWYTVTRTFDEFARYLERTGVQRGIINNVRCQLAKTPKDFVAGNREVAR